MNIANALKRKIDEVDPGKTGKAANQELLDTLLTLQRAPDVELHQGRLDQRAKFRKADKSKTEAELIKDITFTFFDHRSISPDAFTSLLQFSDEFKLLRLVAGAESGREMVCFGQRGYSSDPSAVANALEDVVREVKHKIETAKEPDGWRAKMDATKDKKKSGETWPALRTRTAAILTSSAANLKSNTDLVKDAFRRLDMEETLFDTDGYLLGGEDGVVDSTTGTVEFRPHSVTDLVTMSVGYDIGNLENERCTDTFKKLNDDIINKLLPVKDVRVNALALMAKIVFDGFYAWREKLIIWLIAPKDYAKTTLTRLLALALGGYAITETARVIEDPPVSDNEWGSFLQRASKTRFIRIDEGARKKKYSWLLLKKLSSSSAQTYREMYKLNRRQVDRIGMIGVSCNPAEAPERPASNDDLGRCIVFDHTMLTFFGEEEDASRRMAKKLTELAGDKELMPYRRAFLLLLMDHYTSEKLVFNDKMIAARERWDFDLPPDNEDEEAIDDDVETCSVQVDEASRSHTQSLPSSSTTKLVEWMRSSFTPCESSYIRMFDAYAELEKHTSILGTATKPNQSPAALKLEACNRMRICCEQALGIGNCFVIGQGNNKSIYYGKQTTLGRANGGGVKIPGWHIPGYKIVSTHQRITSSGASSSSGN